MDEQDDVDSWLEAAGFVTTPPREDSNDALDLESLRTRLNELARSAEHSPSPPSPVEPKVRVRHADLRVLFAESEALRRSYAVGVCDTLVITFGGLTEGFPGVQTPGVAQHEFVGSCKRIGVTHALFVRDLLQSWYIRHAAPPSKDAFDSVLRLLRHEIGALRPSRIVVFGASMGGYAAIRAGVALGADLVVAFGPQVFVDPEQRRMLALPLGVMDPPLEALQRNAEGEGIRPFGAIAPQTAPSHAAPSHPPRTRPSRCLTAATA